MSAYNNHIKFLSGVPVFLSPMFYKTVEEGHFSDFELEAAKSMREFGYFIFEFDKKSFESNVDLIVNHIKDNKNRVQDEHLRCDGIRNIATNEMVLNLLTKIYGRKAFPFQTLAFNYGTEQHFHSDNVHFSSMPNKFMCGVWVALEDIHPESGPLYLYPKSHLLEDIYNETIGHFSDKTNTQNIYHRAWLEMVTGNNLQGKEIILRKGQAVIWASNLLHGGKTVGDRNLTRRSMVTHYYFDDCKYWTPMNSYVSKGNIVFRNPVKIF